MSTPSAVLFEQVSRHFEQIKAVDAVDLAIQEGEFFAMLGPSGSGKTTCLRLIAGFEQPSSGQIKIFGEAMAGIPPYRRQVNTVFQDYALFPHLNILDNVAYGLMIRGVDKKTRLQAAEETLALVQLTGFSARKPAQLSGGQRQRVALARALVNQPNVLLLDEPLGALDLKLREQMQEELKALQKQLGITFVFVTHDQGEALSMADRIAVFNQGKIIQVDTPLNLYRRPNSPFVANFVGSSNVLAPALVQSLGLPNKWASLRPEDIQLVTTGGYSATLLSRSYMGSANRVQLAFKDQVLHALLPHHTVLPSDKSSVQITWQPNALHLMDSP